MGAPEPEFVMQGDCMVGAMRDEQCGPLQVLLQRGCDREASSTRQAQRCGPQARLQISEEAPIWRQIADFAKQSSS